MNCMVRIAPVSSELGSTSNWPASNLNVSKEVLGHPEKGRGDDDEAPEEKKASQAHDEAASGR